MAAFTYNYPDPNNALLTKSRIQIQRSSDSGLSWADSGLVTTSTVNAWFSMVGTDGNGTWMLLYSTYSNSSYLGGPTYVQKTTDFGATWTAPIQLSTNTYKFDSIAADGNGRWIATIQGSPIRCIGSEDNGETWGPVQTVPWTFNSIVPTKCVYLGNGKWGIAEAHGSSVNFFTLTWGASAVDDWDLY
jgi:hypothetical protein